MKKISILSVAIAAATLTACGGGDNSPDKPNLCADINVERCDQVIIPESSSASSSSLSPPANNLLPLTEEFTAPSAPQVFIADYKSLLNSVAEDPNPAFFYATSGLDEARIASVPGKLTIGNARFTIAQGYVAEGTHLDPAVAVANYKVNTTTAKNDGQLPTSTTWGELDLSHAWKMSFCVENWEHTGSTANNQLFMLYIDNNGTNKDASYHGQDSLLVQTNVEKFVKGKRIEITVPGEVRSNGVLIDEVFKNPGTTTSFLQVRVPSAANLTMSKLWLGYQDDTSTEPAADSCTEGTIVPGWNIPTAPPVPETLTFLPGSGQLRANWSAAPRATKYAIAYNTVDLLEGATVVEDISGTTHTITGLENGTTYYVFVRASNTGGDSEWSSSFTGVPEIPATPPQAVEGQKAYADDRRVFLTWAVNEEASSYRIFQNTVNNLEGATELATVADNFYRVKNLVNDAAYYFFIAAVNDVGSSDVVTVAATPKTPAPNIYQANFDVTREQFFDSVSNMTLNTVPSVQTISYDNEQAMAFVFGGADNMQIVDVDGVKGLRVTNSRFTIGQEMTANDNGTYTTVITAAAIGDVPAVLQGGVLDLTKNYQICYSVIEKHTAGLFQVYLDNNTSGQGNSIHGNPSRLISTPVVDIPLNVEQCFDAVDNKHYGTANSFIQVRVDSNGGDVGVVLSSLKIVDLGTTPIKDIPASSSSSAAATSSVSSLSSTATSQSSEASSSVDADSSEPASSSSVPSSVASSDSSSSVSSTAGGGTSSSAAWVGSALELVGVSDQAISGSVSVNQNTSITLTATGGNLSSSSHHLFFAHKEIAKSDFVFTARIASVSGADNANGNSYRFGLMVMSDISTAANYADLAAWADIGFYVNPALVGSRANMKADNTRSRSDIASLEIGHYVRIEVFDEGTSKRVRRLTSTDGINFTQANSTIDFKATSDTDNWFVGVYAAPGTNTLTVAFDNIVIEDYVAPTP